MRRQDAISGVAVITGGSQGIGAACVRRFLEKGWRVSTVALPGDAPQFCSGPSVLAISGDITWESVRQELLEQTLERYGRIDVLVNNAGVGMYAPVSSMLLESFRLLFEVNVMAALRLTQLVIPIMRRSAPGAL